MAKVGLKDTLALLAKGYSKKEIDALAAVDEENEAEQKDEAPAPAQAPVEEKKEEEPDYKAMYEELVAKRLEDAEILKKKDEQIKNIQKTNINSNVLPDIEKSRQEAQDSLIDALRSFY